MVTSHRCSLYHCGGSSSCRHAGGIFMKAEKSVSSILIFILLNSFMKCSVCLAKKAFVEQSLKGYLTYPFTICQPFLF